MAGRRLKPPLSLSLLGLFLAILASLYLMSTATQNASHLGPLYSWLLLINSLASILLLGLVGANVYSLFNQIKKRKAGSSLTARMVILFTLLTLAPASVVFYFSMQFVQQSIDSWFDVRIDQAMEDALKLGQAALDERMRAVLNQTEEMALHLRDIPESLLPVRLEEVRDDAEDGELTVFSNRDASLPSAADNRVPLFLICLKSACCYRSSRANPMLVWSLTPPTGDRFGFWWP